MGLKAAPTYPELAKQFHDCVGAFVDLWWKRAEMSHRDLHQGSEQTQVPRSLSYTRAAQGKEGEALEFHPSAKARDEVSECN